MRIRVSLLSPIAADLSLTEGQAGQAIDISGISAVLTSLSISTLIGSTDRKLVLLGFTLLLAMSGAIVALAPNYPVLMGGRALLRVVIGGFWSMSVAVVMRLVPTEAVPKGLAILNGGIAIATVIAAPLGSFMGGLIGWRGAFVCVVPIAIISVIWQARSLPLMPASPRQNGGNSMVTLLRRPPVFVGMSANLVIFTGQFALFTYLRPFIEQVT